MKRPRSLLSFADRSRQSDALHGAACLLFVFAAPWGCKQIQDVGATLSGSTSSTSGAGSTGVTSGTGGMPSTDSTSGPSSGPGAGGTMGTGGTMGSGTGGGPPLSCDNGLVACAGVCRDLKNNPQHCGACGRSCLGGPCGKGKCPIETLLGTYDFGTFGASVSNPPVEIVTDANFFFWNNIGYRVSRANLDGTAVVGLSAKVKSSPDGYLAMDTKYLYWSASSGIASGEIVRVPKLGGAAESLVTFPSLRPYALAMDEKAHRLFVASRGSYQDPLTKTSVVGVIATDAPENGFVELGVVDTKFIDQIAIDATYIYATASDTGLLVRLPRKGGAVEPLATGFIAPSAVAVDDKNLYLLDGGKDGFSGPFKPGSLVRIPLDGGPAVALLKDLASPNHLVLDGENVYLTAGGTYPNSYQDGSVIRVSKQGGMAAILADDNRPRGLAVQGGYVYWSSSEPNSSNNAIRRTPK